MRHTQLKLLAAMAVAMAAASASAAQATTYSSKVAYDAANSTTNDVTFGGIADPGTYVSEPNPYTVGNLSIAGADNSVSSASFFGSPTDTYFNNVFSDGTPATGSIFTFTSPVTSAGFIVAAGSGSGTYDADVFDGSSLVSSSTFDADDLNTFDSFFGVSNVGPITAVDLYLTDPPNETNFVLVSEVVSGGSISAAPEPSTWALMIAGVGMVGGALRFGRRSGSPATA